MDRLEGQKVRYSEAQKREEKQLREKMRTQLRSSFAMNDFPQIGPRKNRNAPFRKCYWVLGRTVTREN